MANNVREFYCSAGWLAGLDCPGPLFGVVAESAVTEDRYRSNEIERADGDRWRRIINV